MVQSPVRTFQLNSLSELELHHVEAEMVTYRGRHAVRLVEQEEPTTSDHAIAVLSGSDFKDGVIETEIAGDPAEGCPPRYARLHRHRLSSTAAWLALRMLLRATDERTCR